MFTVSYVGNHGYDLQETVNANMYASSTSTKNYGVSYGGLPSAAPDARFVTVTQYYNNGISNYNALTLRIPAHVQLWVISPDPLHLEPRAGDTASPTRDFNPFNLSNSYGSLGFDNRHQVAGDFLWSQPFKTSNKAVNGLIAGWTVAFKMYLYSGAPFSVTDSKIATDVNASGVLTPLADLVVPSAFSTNCNGGNAIGTPCLPKTDFATYPGSGCRRPDPDRLGQHRTEQLPRPRLLRYRHDVAAQLSPSKRSISSPSACRLTTFSTTRTSPILREPLHRARSEKSPALSARPPAFTVRARALRFRDA